MLIAHLVLILTFLIISSNGESVQSVMERTVDSTKQGGVCMDIRKKVIHREVNVLIVTYVNGKSIHAHYDYATKNLLGEIIAHSWSPF